MRCRVKAQRHSPQQSLFSNYQGSACSSAQPCIAGVGLLDEACLLDQLQIQQSLHSCFCGSCVSSLL